MNTEMYKKTVCDRIDQNRKMIIEIGQTILENPEMGYKEFKTAQTVTEVFNELKIPYKEELAITGVKGVIKGNKSKSMICIIGEMDAVTCAAHPMADKLTCAAHACGHNAQIASMLGSAYGLTGIIDMLDGDIAFLAAPAEEYVEIEYRQELVKQGKISFLGGKQEMIKQGIFDDVDIAMMIHAQASAPKQGLFIHGSSLGFLAKTISFIGKEAHAGGAPYEGINALNAAMAAIMCIHAQRETFKDEDKIRVHPIITKGGELVNIVPAEVNMETYVRGSNFTAIKSASQTVDRAIKGAAYAIGAQAIISNIAGYLPLNQDYAISELFRENAEAFIAKENIYTGIDLTGSTDMGDLSNLMPCVHPTMGGFDGNAHSRDFKIVDVEQAYIIPAKIMAMTAIDLLADEAKKAIDIKKSFKPLITKNDYIQSLYALNKIV